MNIPIIKHFRRNQTGFSLSALRQDFYVSFYVYKSQFDGDKVSYETTNGDYTEDLSRAGRFIKGSVKWDSCSNWTFEPDQEFDVALHFCSKDEAELTGFMFATCYNLAKELMPEHASNFED